ncbi:MAG: 4-hydroxythreonine-4-phosphate dehydrogenase PdxA [Gammaproteobacteria bacterium]
MIARPCPRIVITAGEPAGIGPDLIILLAQREHPGAITVIADPELLSARAARLKLPLHIEPFTPEDRTLARCGAIKLIPVRLACRVVDGRLDKRNAPSVVEALAQACRGCMDGTFDAMVTAPVHKGILNDAGIPFTGHTEYLAAATGGHFPVMMLCTPELRVALATTHVPLRAVSDLITGDRIVSVLRTLARDLRARFGLNQPRIAVCGLNPHAGEGGHLGTEEIDHIIPAIETVRAEGLRVEGPLPADTAFVAEQANRADVVLAMYHDQGLPVLKYQGFGRAVNVTLGLPIIRTSVDHGTALLLAGTGQADPSSLLAALDTAFEMARSAATYREG